MFIKEYQELFKVFCTSSSSKYTYNIYNILHLSLYNTSILLEQLSQAYDVASTKSDQMINLTIVISLSQQQTLKFFKLSSLVYRKFLIKRAEKLIISKNKFAQFAIYLHLHFVAAVPAVVVVVVVVYFA